MVSPTLVGSFVELSMASYHIKNQLGIILPYMHGDDYLGIMPDLGTIIRVYEVQDKYQVPYWKK